ncbi:hypothetical protein [Deinococcus aquiradiocola]|uniref:Adhesin domain-containing protein n=1 Tax=Deinococcus aquiradiocola TaxID=393059 RepID=A0A917PFP3_9DEIO|nr:hypothetical protein [Deinococcus aquiradiocola]GGJ75379.1 hypothetical protein GCM10008939_19540 [Deinococcus aquiradiocola]
MTTPERPEKEPFELHVQRLVTEGKLTPEEAAELLAPAHPEPRSVSAAQPGTQGVQLAKAAPAPSGDTPPDLRLDVAGYALQVLHDASLTEPRLTATHDGILSLRATPDGWTVDQRSGTRLLGLKAVLSLPFAPRHARAEVSGGSLSLPTLSGTARLEVSGGNATLGGATELRAEVSGGNLTSGAVTGSATLEVNGGNLSVTGTTALHGEVNGGNLRWGGLLTDGHHRLEVNGGQATLTLDPGSDLTFDADVTLGNVTSSFPVQKTGGMMHAHYHGTLGNGRAVLSCQVNAGQVRLVTT